MSEIFVILLGLLVMNTVGGEEESPVAISQSADKDERTAIHEDLQPNDNSRTINIKIINSEPLEQAISKSASDNDSHLKRSAEIESPLTDIEERISLSEDMEDQVSESKIGDKTGIQERSETEANDDHNSREDFEAAIRRATKSSDVNIEPSLPEEVSRTDGDHAMSDPLASIESEGKSVTHDMVLDTKGRAGDSSTSLEEVKAVSAEDVRTFKSLKPLDSSVLRRRLSDILIPNYVKTLSRSTLPYTPTTRNFQNKPPYFGRLNFIPSQGRRFENSGIENTRRTGGFSTESGQHLKLLDDYTDPDSNAYQYVPVTSMRPIQRITQNDDLQQKLLDVASQKLLSQIKPYSNEFRPVQYAANYPYGANLARYL